MVWTSGPRKLIEERCAEVKVPALEAEKPIFSERRHQMANLVILARLPAAKPGRLDRQTSSIWLVETVYQKPAVGTAIFFPGAGCSRKQRAVTY